jgi:hypothetical protein
MLILRIVSWPQPEPGGHQADKTDISRPDRLSSAEIASICQAAGLQGKLAVANESTQLTL